MTAKPAPKYIHENYMVGFVGDRNDGKSYQCDSAMEARMPNGDFIVDGAVWFNAETSTGGTAKSWADPSRVLVVPCTSAGQMLAEFHRLLPVPGRVGAVPTLPSGRRIDAVILDSVSGLASLEESVVRAELRAASEAHPARRKLNPTSNERPENDERMVKRHVAGRVCPIVDALHAAAAHYHLLALFTCHDTDKFVDEEVVGLGGKREVVSRRVGRRLACSPTVVAKLRAAANAIWWMHAVLPDFTGRDARLVNAAAAGDDPTLRRRYGCITDRGTYGDGIGDLGDVCKRQGDGEGTPWQRAFGASVPTWWHPDHVAVFDPANPDAPAEVPCAQPHFGRVLELAVGG